MKIFEMIDMKTGVTKYYKRKNNMCLENNLTSRLVSYVLRGDRMHHKNYKFNKVEYDNQHLEDDVLYNNNNDELLNEENIKLRRNLQRLKDQNTILRKEMKTTHQQTNKSSSILNDILECVEELEYEKKVILPINKDKEGLIQLSDLHLNSVIDIEGNVFDFDIADKRLNKLFRESDDIFKRNNINKITIALTGDIFNLDSHIEKKMTNEYNKSVGFIKGFQLLIKYLDELVKKYNVSFVSVVGNESRLSEKFPNIDILASDNFDYLLFQLIKMRYNKTATFLNGGDKIEEVIKIKDKNIHLSHGNYIKQSKGGDKNTRIKMLDLDTIKLRWLKKSNIILDFFIFGHIHSALNGLEFARSGSLCGSDGYADKQLNIISDEPSQNVIIISKDNVRVNITSLSV